MGSHTAYITRLYDHLAKWGRRMSQRVTVSDDQLAARRRGADRVGILPFLVDGSEVPEELTARYRGPVRDVHAGTKSENKDS